MYRHLLLLLAFFSVTSLSFGTTLYIKGQVLNTNSSGITVEVSTDGFRTKHTVTAISSGTPTSYFSDSVVTTSPDSLIWFRISTCDSSTDMVVLTWDPRDSVAALYPTLDYCKRTGPTCFADFTYTVKDSTITLTNQSKATNPYFIWTMGDGTNYKSKNVTHTYKKDSTYVICLYLTDTIAGCSDKFCAAITIGKNSGQNCKAQFAIRKDSNAKYGVVVVNQSTGSNLAYYWDFGDGNYSSLKNPTHTYTSFGKYNLCLTVLDTNSSGTRCVSTYCDTIGMDSSGKLLKAGFTITVVDEELSVRSVVNEDIKLFPNPVDEILNIEIPSDVSVNSVTVIDLRGITVMEITEREAMKAVNVRNLSNGTYLLLVNTDSGIIHRKFSKM